MFFWSKKISFNQLLAIVWKLDCSSIDNRDRDLTAAMKIIIVIMG